MKASYTSSIIYIYIYRYKILPSNHTYIHVCVCLCVCVFMLMPYMLYAVGVKPVGKLACGARSAQWSSTYTTIYVSYLRYYIRVLILLHAPA